MCLSSHRCRRQSSISASLMVAFSLALAPHPALGISLADFIPRLSNLQPQCNGAYTTHISGCTPPDFGPESLCSQTCIDGLKALVPKVIAACADDNLPPHSIIGVFLTGVGVEKLCPGGPRPPTPPPNSSPPNGIRPAPAPLPAPSPFPPSKPPRPSPPSQPPAIRPPPPPLPPPPSPSRSPPPNQPGGAVPLPGFSGRPILSGGIPSVSTSAPVAPTSQTSVFPTTLSSRVTTDSVSTSLPPAPASTPDSSDESPGNLNGNDIGFGTAFGIEQSAGRAIETSLCLVCVSIGTAVFFAVLSFI